MKNKIISYKYQFEMLNIFSKSYLKPISENGKKLINYQINYLTLLQINYLTLRPITTGHDYDRS